jgi:hypothetical protein
VKQDRDVGKGLRNEDWASVEGGECERFGLKDARLRPPHTHSSLAHTPRNPIRMRPSFHHSPLAFYRHSVTPDLSPG